MLITSSPCCTHRKVTIYISKKVRKRYSLLLELTIHFSFIRKDNFSSSTGRINTERLLKRLLNIWRPTEKNRKKFTKNYDNIEFFQAKLKSLHSFCITVTELAFCVLIFTPISHIIHFGLVGRIPGKSLLLFIKPR